MNLLWLPASTCDNNDTGDLKRFFFFTWNDFVSQEIGKDNNGLWRINIHGQAKKNWAEFIT